MYRIVPLIILLFSGCVYPESEHPVSDDTTSKYDERLVGVWVIEPPPDKDDFHPAHPHIVVIGQEPNHRSRMSLSYLDVGEKSTKDGNEKIRLPLHAESFFALPGKNNYLSFPSKGIGEQGNKYFVVKYKFIDENHLRFLPLDQDAIIQATEKNRLSGKVFPQPIRARKPGKAFGILPLPVFNESATITAKPQELLKFFDQNPDVFKQVKDGFILRRITAEEFERAMNRPGIPCPVELPDFSAFLIGMVFGACIMGVLFFSFHKMKSTKRLKSEPTPETKT
jgi:hypothetical protein